MVLSVHPNADPALLRLQKRLLERSGRGSKYGLERIELALDVLGQPQSRLDAVHVAGTNGKGSVCAMVESIARAAGLKTGLFTSPHLSYLNERIRIDGQSIADAALAEALEIALSQPVTFFETMTIAGFVAMQRAKVDLAIFEVGLGGRLDATNVLQTPGSVAITTIGKDHERILGSCLTTIALEKAGIIKAGAPLTLGKIEEQPRAAILAQARRVGSGEIWALAADEDDARRLEDKGVRPLRMQSLTDTEQPQPAQGPAPTRWQISGPDEEATLHHMALEGRHQRDNAAVASGIIWQLSRQRPRLSAARLGIAEGVANTRWPGRLERLEREDGINIILDCAHNVPAMYALHDATRELEAERTRLVFGAMGDKGVEEMLSLLAARAAHRYYTTPIPSASARASTEPATLAALASGRVFADPQAATSAALDDARPGETILITGSIFLVGAIRPGLLAQRGFRSTCPA